MGGVWNIVDTKLFYFKIGQKVEFPGLDFKKMDKQRKQKACWQDFMISGFLSRFSHMPQTQRWRCGFISGSKSFKINFLGNRSSCVISFKFSKADFVQILVLLASVLPRDIFCDFNFCIAIILFWSNFALSSSLLLLLWIPFTKCCKLDGSFPFHWTVH